MLQTTTRGAMNGNQNANIASQLEQTSINGNGFLCGKKCKTGSGEVTMELFIDIDKEHQLDFYCTGEEACDWLAAKALSRYFILEGKWQKNLGQFISLKNQSKNREIDLDTPIKKNLANGDRVKIDFKIKPASFETSANQKDTFGCIRRKKVVFLDGNSLTCEHLMEMGYGGMAIKLTEESLERVKESRRFLEEGILKSKRITYGINTGFGRFASTVIEEDELELLQENLILSTAAGVGEALSVERTRRMLVLRINVLARGLSGISPTLLQQYIDAYNASCLSLVPEQGTVGASGDLAPLSHLSLGMMGLGTMWSEETAYADADVVLAKHGLKAIKLTAKEGLALINGTQLMTALGVEALVRAERVARQADVVACLTLETLKGIKTAFDADLHRARPHQGQMQVASRLRSLLDSPTYPSLICASQNDPLRVQDAYTLRCIPQVHGIVNDTLKFVRGILETEMNSTTDNPIILPDRRDVISGGNFHGEYPAKGLDYLAIAIHEVSNMSERRTDRLMNPAYSGLPAFLTNKGGLNCGLMIAQYTAASLVSENKVYCHPSSIDSITTCAGTEDHVSMGGWSVRKALKVVQNVEVVVGVELLSACQGLDLLRPLCTTAPLEAVHALVRKHVRFWDKDRYLAPEIEATTRLLRNQEVWKTVEPFLDASELEQWTNVGSKF